MRDLLQKFEEANLGKNLARNMQQAKSRDTFAGSLTAVSHCMDYRRLTRLRNLQSFPWVLPSTQRTYSRKQCEQVETQMTYVRKATLAFRNPLARRFSSYLQSDSPHTCSQPLRIRSSSNSIPSMMHYGRNPTAQLPIPVPGHLISFLSYGKSRTRLATVVSRVEDDLGVHRTCVKMQRYKMRRHSCQPPASASWQLKATISLEIHTCRRCEVRGAQLSRTALGLILGTLTQKYWRVRSKFRKQPDRWTKIFMGDVCAPTSRPPEPAVTNSLTACQFGTSHSSAQAP
jgi:hypothetical protein